ncbi:hypothetical protein, partial [Phaeodactylibacter luteus]
MDGTQKFLIGFAIVSFLGLGIWVYGDQMYKSGLKEGIEAGRKNVIDNAMINPNSIEWVAIDSIDFDYKKYLVALKKLEDGNKAPFVQQTVNLHEQLFHNLAQSYGLNDEQIEKVDSLIKEVSPRMTEIYIQEYRAKQRVYNYGASEYATRYEYYPRAERVSEVLALNICRLLELVIDKKAQLALGAINNLGYDPCSALLKDFLDPFSERLIETGVLVDVEIN